MKKKFLSIILLSFLSVSVFSHNEHYTNLNSLEYDLYRNDELIGYHNYFFKKEGINLKVSSILDIKINKLGIDLYKYNLESIEEYEEDQLVKYSSKTQQNKKTKMTNIELDKKNDKLIISGTENQLISPKEYPVGTWWNHEIIQSKAQISAISGRIIEQRVTFLGKEKLNLYGKTYDALRFNFSSSDENLPEKKQTLKDLGAELIEVDAVPYADPKNYIKQSKKIAEDLAGSNSNGVLWANQFDNTVNAEAHIKTTSQEIWTQTAGQVHGFVCAVGTGGTLAGVSIGLKEKNKNIKIALSDPMGSSLYSHIKFNKLENSGSSITEGIGTARITKNFAKALVDQAYQITDEEALNIIFKLKEEQNISLGGSSGINIAGAIRLAKELGPGHNIVTILCDSGKRYASKIYNKEFLKSKNLPIPSWL